MHNLSKRYCWAHENVHNTRALQYFHIFRTRMSRLNYVVGGTFGIHGIPRYSISRYWYRRYRGNSWYRDTYEYREMYSVRYYKDMIKYAKYAYITSPTRLVRPTDTVLPKLTVYNFTREIKIIQWRELGLRTRFMRISYIQGRKSRGGTALPPKFWMGGFGILYPPNFQPIWKQRKWNMIFF